MDTPTAVRMGDRDAGQDLVEYALTVLLFLALTTFILDGGRILWNYETVAEAIRSGARYATTHSANRLPSAIQPEVENVVQERAWGIGGLHPYVDCPNGCYLGETVQVTTTYRVTPLTPLVWRGLTFDLYAESTMEIQN
jgi:Flp pilus assembly protein TadG